MIFKFIGLMKTVKPAIKSEGRLNFNKKEIREAEVPSVNGNCSARGLAVLGSAMANKGVHNGIRILSESAWENMHADPVNGKLFLDLEIPFTQGGVAQFPDGSNREGYFGWLGYG